ncbi:MAG: LON peptidase substrate-binding domain-containing protein [Thermoprotei archaeon]
MKKIPLFPLSTVLYPKTYLPLIVFEERYKIMLDHCLSKDWPMGVVLIKNGREVGGSAEPCDVGTEAKIVASEKLGNGKYTVVVRGERRFRITWIDYSKPYLQAHVEYIDRNSDEVTEPELKSKIEGFFRKYLEVLEGLGISACKEEIHSLPPEHYSYVVADMLQLGADEKQQLLEASTTTERFRMELEYLVTILRGQKL